MDLLLGPPRVRRTVLMVAAATLAGFLAVVAISEVVLPGPPYAAAAPLASVPGSQPPNAVGALLPAATLSGVDDDYEARDLRPAIILLVQFPCDCSGKVRQVATQADGRKVPVYLVGFRGRPQVDRLAKEIGFGVVPLVDELGVLDAAYSPTADATLLLVRRDGVVTRIVGGVYDEIELGPSLPSLLEVP